ncbi:hypothetical protein VSDG_07383 [Cytospora chrysosperma]|uniref:Non-haem dioxygenase N-terminal domain-containing protein n=1 Tax=Cytospora chrysosperma TaxID=252740 RepID=A0A423VQ32_CYTCH|nr:hypothetical protein VSDG_07383 [Valsa sordida]
MAEVLSPTPAGTAPAPDLKDSSEYVYFHSGSETTYRKVAEKPSSFTSIPTIDLSNIDSPSFEDRKKIAKEIYDACHNCGFFYVQNHGIPEQVVSETFELLKRFFALDHETKMDAHVQKNPAIRGYEPMLETRLDPRTKGGKFTGHFSEYNFC